MLLGYARVSTSEQAADDRSSLENQEKIIRGFAMAKGFTQFDTSIFSDPGVSASIPLRNRPAGKELLETAKAGDTIIASTMDRMFRSAGDATNMIEIFREKKIDLVLFNMGSEPVGTSAVGQFIFTALAAVAQLERTLIKERMTSGKKAKKDKGGHIGGRTPYGFRVVGKGREARLEKDEAEQKIIARVQGLLHDGRAGLSISETTRLLTEEGLTSRNGKPFVKMQVARIISQVRNAAQ